MIILFEHHTIVLGRRCSDTHHIESTIKRIDWLKYKLFPEPRGSLDQCFIRFLVCFADELFFSMVY